MHSVWAQNKRLCTAVELPTKILASLFAPLMFAGLHNQSPLLTMVVRNLCSFRHVIALKVNSIQAETLKIFYLGHISTYGGFKMKMCQKQWPKNKDRWPKTLWSKMKTHKPHGLQFRPQGIHFRPQGLQSSFLGLHFWHNL